MDEVINVFRTYNDSIFDVSILGISQFANKDDQTFAYLLAQLPKRGFNISMYPDDTEECFCILTISGHEEKTNETYND